MMMALRVVASSGALPATVVMPSRFVCRAATTMAMASSWPGSQSRMIGSGCGCVGDIVRELATVTLRAMRSALPLAWCAILAVGAPALAGCSDDPASGSAAAGASVIADDTAGSPSPSDASPTSAPSSQVPATTDARATTTTVGPEPTGVPGIDDPNAFCAAWARYSGSLQAIGVAVAFGDLTSLDVARLEVIGAAALTDAVNGIGSRWPAELVGERSIVLAGVVGPYARRAEKALAALVAAGATEDDLAELRLAWLDALRYRDPAMPVIDVPGVPARLGNLIEAAARAFDEGVTPFAQDPSLAASAGDTPATDAYLATTCPDLASSGVGDAI